MRSDSLQNDWIRECIADLDGRYDQAGLRMIFEVGIFAADDPSPFAELVDGLADDQKFDDRVYALGEKLHATGLTKEQSGLVTEIIDLEMNRREETRDAAYLLGIAVGRRLGPPSVARPVGPSRPKARKAR